MDQKWIRETEDRTCCQRNGMSKIKKYLGVSMSIWQKKKFVKGIEEQKHGKLACGEDPGSGSDLFCEQ